MRNDSAEFGCLNHGCWKKKKNHVNLFEIFELFIEIDIKININWNILIKNQFNYIGNTFKCIQLI